MEAIKTNFIITSCNIKVMNMMMQIHNPVIIFIDMKWVKKYLYTFTEVN